LGGVGARRACERRDGRGVATMGGCARKTKKGRCVSHPSRGMKKGVGAVVDPVAQPGSGPS
jgi:hypothetical protein